LLDQFAYRYTRLQDGMGARLMPAVLKALGEDIGPMSAIDRFTRLNNWPCAMFATSLPTTTPIAPQNASSGYKPPPMLRGNWWRYSSNSRTN
jgi:hypothetical protein